MKKITLIVILSLCCELLLAADKDSNTKRNILIDDTFLIKVVGAPAISPDGEWVAYGVITTVLAEDDYTYRVWMVPAVGGEAIPLTADSAESWSPKWSKDGKWLYFLSDRNDKRVQLWKLNMVHGGEAIQVSKMEKRGLTSFSFSSNEQKLLMVLNDRDPEDIKAELDEDYLKPTSKPPYVIDRLQFKEDYKGYLSHRRDHVYVYDIPSHKLTQITYGDYDDSSPVWSPNDKWIAFSSNRSDNPDGNYNDDIWIVAANNTDQGHPLRKLTSNGGKDFGPKWSPDGKWIAYNYQVEEHHVYALSHVAIIPAEGGEVTLLTETHDRSISSYRWASDSKKLYGILESEGMESLVSLSITDNSMEKIITGKQVVNSYDISDAGKVVAQISRPTVPGEIYALDEIMLKKITTVNEELLSQLNLSEIENFSFKSVDEREIQGFIYKPIGYEEGKQYPSILRIHGGPMSQYNYGFAEMAQIFAANGYLVVRTNPRGSSGYGKNFVMGNLDEDANIAYHDVINGLDYAIEKGLADSERLGVGGWSYGGILTNIVLINTTRFKAATTGASSVTGLANYGHDMYQRWWEYGSGLPWEGNNREEKYIKHSMINYVEKVKTPTLILCGENDWNVPVMNSEILYQSLKRLGVDTELIVYPGQSHGGFPPSYDKDVYERYLAWFQKYLKY